MSGAQRYEELCDDLIARHPGIERAKMMGMASVKRDGKLVAVVNATPRSPSLVKSTGIPSRVSSIKKRCVSFIAQLCFLISRA